MLANKINPIQHYQLSNTAGKIKSLIEVSEEFGPGQAEAGSSGTICARSTGGIFLGLDHLSHESDISTTFLLYFDSRNLEVEKTHAPNVTLGWNFQLTDKQIVCTSNFATTHRDTILHTNRYKFLPGAPEIAP